MNKELAQKYGELKKAINKLDNAIVAFSGGVDSALVLKAAYDALGNNVVAVTADSPSLPRRELEEAKNIAEKTGAKHLVIGTKETENQNYIKNPSNRCYYCKSELYSKLRAVAEELGIKNILNGTNFDDLSDYRPGLKAAEEFNIISPLKDARLTKKEVRELAKYLGLEIWDKPSSPCLSSRIPYGSEVTLKKLAMIEESENFIKDLGIKELRVRNFGDAARIEVKEEDKKIVNENFYLIEKKLSEIGFSEIFVLDFKSGNLNLVVRN